MNQDELDELAVECLQLTMGKIRCGDIHVAELYMDCDWLKVKLDHGIELIRVMDLGHERTVEDDSKTTAG